MKRFTVVIEQDPSGKYTLTVPALPGYVACGDTEDEVLELAREGNPFTSLALPRKVDCRPAAEMLEC